MMREQLKRLATGMFLAADRVGLHVQPAHYYSSVASRKDLRDSEPLWRRPLQPIPFEWDLAAQADWMASVARSAAELSLSEIYEGSETVGGFRYGPIEGQLLYGAIRALEPARIVEIGSGSSTWIMSKAVQRNVAEDGPSTGITACDPYTAERVKDLPHVTAKAVGGLSIAAEVATLTVGDLLFIDSTHTVRTGSELAHLYLEVLPSLRPGVIVHIHDIYLPYLFAPNIYTSMFDWQETTLVAALLAGSNHFKVLTCMSALHRDRPEALTAAFPEYRPQSIDRGLYAGQATDGHFPSALWLRVTD